MSPFLADVRLQGNRRCPSFLGLRRRSAEACRMTFLRAAASHASAALPALEAQRRYGSRCSSSCRWPLTAKASSTPARNFIPFPCREGMASDF